MSARCTYLFAISFLFGNESGLAIVSATNERKAWEILRNQGKYNGSPDGYQIEATRNVGLYTQEQCTLILESYTNALVAFDAITSFISKHPTPTFTVEQTSEGAIITATDENGTTSAILYHGEKGEAGAQGVGIKEIRLNDDNSLTFYMTNGAVHDTQPIYTEGEVDLDIATREDILALFGIGGGNYIENGIIYLADANYIENGIIYFNDATTIENETINLY